MSALTDAVRTALSQTNMAEATADIKQLLCDEFARADPSAQIHRTEYFNHTYLPDVVLDWPAGDRREVFVRFVTSPERLIADSNRLGAAGPILFDLAAAAVQIGTTMRWLPRTSPPARLPSIHPDSW